MALVVSSVRLREEDIAKLKQMAKAMPYVTFSDLIQQAIHNFLEIEYPVEMAKARKRKRKNSTVLQG